MFQFTLRWRQQQDLFRSRAIADELAGHHLSLRRGMVQRKFPVFKGLGARGYPRNSKRYGVVVRVPTLVSRGEHDGRLQGVD
jgi:hypothetical protein